MRLHYTSLMRRKGLDIWTAESVLDSRWHKWFMLCFIIFVSAEYFFCFAQWPCAFLSFHNLGSNSCSQRDDHLLNLPWLAGMNPYQPPKSAISHVQASINIWLTAIVIPVANCCPDLRSKFSHQETLVWRVGSTAYSKTNAVGRAAFERQSLWSRRNSARLRMCA